MAISLKNTNKAYEILKSYNGNNSYIISLKNGVFAYKNVVLNELQIEYILKNHEFTPFVMNKIIKIADWFGEKKKIDWGLEFLPEKLLVGYYLGETDEFYHMYVKFRQSQDKYVPTFIPKKALLNPLFLEDFNEKNVDFEKYNEIGNITLKPQQEQGVKFLTTRKKAILAHQMGRTEKQSRQSWPLWKINMKRCLSYAQQA